MTDPMSMLATSVITFVLFLLVLALVRKDEP
jgi:hypothetical protein